MNLLLTNQVMQMIKLTLNRVMQKLFEKGLYFSLSLCELESLQSFYSNCMLLYSDEEHVGVDSLISIVHDLWSTNTNNDE